MAEKSWCPKCGGNLNEKGECPRGHSGLKSKTNPFYYEIQESDVGRPSITCFGRTWSVSNHWGKTMKRDVGKYVRQTSPGVLQIENDEQFAQRLKQLPKSFEYYRHANQFRSPGDMLEYQIYWEQQAIDGYRLHAQYAKDKGDLVTSELFNHIMADEEHHKRELLEQLEKILGLHG